MKTAPKERLDVLLVERGSADSREAARRLIMAGEVRVNGQVVSKPGQRVSVDAPISLRAAPRFVSRGGEKLDAALSAFGLSVEGLVCADVGASTGGFTDCLLQRGAHKVYAIDVGYGQLDYRLRGDSRVVVMERVNARYLESLPEKVSFVCLDASFIPLKLLLPAVIGWLQEQAEVIPLIKPQFEAGRADVGKNGVVRSAEVHARVLHEVLYFAHESGFGVGGLVRSPLKGPAGNAEFLAWLTWGQGKGINFEPLIPGVLEASALELPPIRSETEDQTENQS
ncbi:16S/23S rRNA (cytidine-2'-O)-methyltransferase TlyA [Anaerolineae bacterium]|nr:16S/23S rRNA (cytidine-2'-O)-methyltransferase TlyA [Anaerolineae bacterium]